MRAAGDGGEIGNLLIEGDSTCAYLLEPARESKTTIQGEWIRTGDKYCSDADGYFCYAGRTDDMLKVGGLWVSPVEVESALIDHPAVQECGVVGRDDRDGLSKPFAFVVLPTSAGEPGARGRAAAVRARAPRGARGRAGVEFLPELPKTATGKIQATAISPLA